MTDKETKVTRLTDGRTQTPSGLNLMINTNKKADIEDPENFAKLIDVYCRNMERFIDIYNVGDPLVPYSSRKAKGLEVSYEVEVGPDKKLLHAHIEILGAVYDAGIVRLNLDNTRAFLRECLGYVPRVSVRKANAGSAGLRNYIAKSHRT